MWVDPIINKNSQTFRVASSRDLSTCPNGESKTNKGTRGAREWMIGMFDIDSSASHPKNVMLPCQDDLSCFCFKNLLGAGRHNTVWNVINLRWRLSGSFSALHQWLLQARKNEIPSYRKWHFFSRSKERSQVVPLWLVKVMKL